MGQEQVQHAQYVEDSLLHVQNYADTDGSVVRVKSNHDSALLVKQTGGYKLHVFSNEYKAYGNLLRTFNFTNAPAFDISDDHLLVVLDGSTVSYYDIHLMQMGAIDILYASDSKPYSLEKEIVVNFTIEANNGDETKYEEA